MRHNTLLQTCSSDILNIFIHIEEVIESNTIRRMYIGNKELFQLLSEDINKNLDIITKHLYLLYENSFCAKIYTNQIIQIEYQAVTMDSMMDEIMEYIDILPVYTYDSSNKISRNKGENEDENEEYLEPYSSDLYYPIEILSREMLYLFVDNITIIKETFRTMKVPYIYEWNTKKELKFRYDYKIKNVKKTFIELFISLLNRMRTYNKIANEYRYAISNEEYQHTFERFQTDYDTLLRGTDYFIEEFKDEKDIQNLVDISKIQEIKELFANLDIKNYDQTKEIINTTIQYFSDFVIYVNREEVIKEIEKKLEKEKEDILIVRPNIEPGEPIIIGKDIPFVWGDATLHFYDIQGIEMAGKGHQNTFEDALDWYINYYFNIYLEEIKRAASEELMKKYGLDHLTLMIKDLPFIAPVYKYEFALMNPYVIGWDYAILPLPFVKTEEECKKYNGSMYKYNNNRICVRPFGEKDQSEWKDEIGQNKGGYLGPIKDKILEIVTNSKMPSKL